MKSSLSSWNLADLSGYSKLCQLKFKNWTKSPFMIWVLIHQGLSGFSDPASRKGEEALGEYPGQLCPGAHVLWSRGRQTDTSEISTLMLGARQSIREPSQERSGMREKQLLSLAQLCDLAHFLCLPSIFPLPPEHVLRGHVHLPAPSGQIMMGKKHTYKKNVKVSDTYLLKLFSNSCSVSVIPSLSSHHLREAGIRWFATWAHGSSRWVVLGSLISLWAWWRCHTSSEFPVGMPKEGISCGQRVC